MNGQPVKPNCWLWSTRKKAVDIVTKKTVHYLPDGKVYTGPTLKVGSTVMTGAKHTPASKTLKNTPPKPKK